MYKAFCDTCGDEIELETANHNDIHFDSRKLGPTSVLVTIREQKPKGEACEHFTTCRGCVLAIFEVILLNKRMEDTKNGEEAEPKVARVSPEWEGP